jgi:hypothetical protein
MNLLLLWQHQQHWYQPRQAGCLEAALVATYIDVLFSMTVRALWTAAQPEARLLLCAVLTEPPQHI